MGKAFSFSTGLSTRIDWTKWVEGQEASFSSPLSSTNSHSLLLLVFIS